MEKVPILATLNMQANRIYFPQWVRDLAGMNNGQDYEVYLTDREGVIILERVPANKRR